MYLVYLCNGIYLSGELNNIGFKYHLVLEVSTAELNTSV